jgi:hypothetical protein
MENNMTEQQELVYKLGSIFAALFSIMSEKAETQKASWKYANLMFETEEAMDELL